MSKNNKKIELNLFRKWINGELIKVDTSKKDHFPKNKWENLNVKNFLNIKCTYDHEILKENYPNYNYCPICWKHLPVKKLFWN